MNKNLKKLMVSLSLSASLIGVNQLAVAEDSAYVKFALDRAHARGFTGCDAAISTAYKEAMGKDFRIQTNTLSESQDIHDSMFRMTSVHGSKDDTVFTDATFLKVGSSCHTHITGMYTVTAPCAKVMKEDNRFKFETEVLGTLWSKSPGGTLKIYHPATINSCAVTFSISVKQ